MKFEKKIDAFEAQKLQFKAINLAEYKAYVAKEYLKNEDATVLDIDVKNDQLSIAYVLPEAESTGNTFKYQGKEYTLHTAGLEKAAAIDLVAQIKADGSLAVKRTNGDLFDVYKF